MCKLEEFREAYDLPTAEVEDLLGQESVNLGVATIVAADDRLVFSPFKYPENWARYHDRLLKAGFEVLTDDAETAEYLFEGTPVQARTLFAVLGAIGAQPGESVPEPRHRQAKRLEHQSEADDGLNHWHPSWERFSAGALDLASGHWSLAVA